MSRIFTGFSTALAGVALASLPILADAQSTAPQPEPPAGSTHQQERRDRTTDRQSPQHHLDEAKRVLNSIDQASLEGDARTQVAELERQFSQLENAWRSQAAESARGAAERSAHSTGHAAERPTGTTGAPDTQGERADAAAGTQAWMAHYRQIDEVLRRLIGADARRPAETAGTAGRADAGRSADVMLDASVRGRLQEFRRHLDQFHATAMQQHQRMGEEDRASADPQSGVTGAMTGTRGAEAAAGIDSSAIARITASIDELLEGTATADPSRTADRPTGTAGSAGTASAGTVCVDRAKLEQLRRDVQALQTPRQ